MLVYINAHKTKVLHPSAASERYANQPSGHQRYIGFEGAVCLDQTI